jgi:hypothetical protein
MGRPPGLAGPGIMGRTVPSTTGLGPAWPASFCVGSCLCLVDFDVLWAGSNGQVYYSQSCG